MLGARFKAYLRPSVINLTLFGRTQAYKHTGFSRYKTEKSILKLAKVEEFELESSIAGTSVIPHRTELATSEFQTKLDSEVTTTAASIIRTTGSLTVGALNDASQRIYIDDIMIGTVQMSKGICRFTPEYSLKGKADRGHTDYHLMVGETEVLIVEAKDGFAEGKIRDILAQVVAPIISARFQFAQKIAARNNMPVHQAEEHLKTMASYGALTCGDKWVFLKYAWVNDRWTLTYTPTDVVPLYQDMYDNKLDAKAQTVAKDILERALKTVMLKLVAICREQEEALANFRRSEGV